MLRLCSQPWKGAYQVVAVWWPSPVQEDFQSAANFHTLLSPLCISSACTRGEGEPGERQRGCLSQTGGYVCFMVLSGQTQRVFRPLALVITSQTYTHGGGTGWTRPDSTCLSSFKCVCAHVMCAHTFLSKCVLTAAYALYFRKHEQPLLCAHCPLFVLLYDLTDPQSQLLSGGQCSLINSSCLV